MRAVNISMHDFLKQDLVRYIVPVYQRNYEWDDSDCRQLWYDVYKVATSGESHFFGTICYKTEEAHLEKRYFLIDGQQRITSLMLLLKAIYDVTDDTKVKDYLNTFLLNHHPLITSDDEKYVRLRLNDADNEVYRCILFEDFEKVLTNRQKNSAVYRNYYNFKQRVEWYQRANHDLFDIVSALQQLPVVGLEIESENPQDIFASLNSTGKNLSHVDLLRNYIFMQFSYEEQKKLYVQWKDIEDNVREHMTDFFIDYLICVNKSNRFDSSDGRQIYIEAKNLYTVFIEFYKAHKYGDDFNRTLYLLEDMVNKAGLYTDFCFRSDFEITNSMNVVQRKLYELVEMARSYKIGGLLLYLSCEYDDNRLSEEDFLTCLECLITYVIRIRITGKHVDAMLFNAQVIRYLNTYAEKSFVTLFWDALGEGAYSMPGDEAFQESLQSFDFVRNKDALKYMLLKYISVQEQKDIFDVWNSVLDFVWPRKRNSVWSDLLSRKDKSNYKKFVFTLGNAVILEPDVLTYLVQSDEDIESEDFDVSEISTERCSLDEKLILYDCSKYQLTHDLSNITSWSGDDIRKRTNDLSEKLLSVFEYPKHYQDRALSSVEEYDLDSDFDKFVSRRPSELHIGNKKIPVGAWKVLFKNVCEELYEMDKGRFLKLAHAFSWLYVEYKDEYASTGKYDYLCGNVYTKGNGTVPILNRLKKLLSQYDELYQTNWYNNVTFIVK